MEHTERHGRHGGLLYSLLLVAAVAVIILSIIGIATMSGLMANTASEDGAAQKSERDHKGKPAGIESPGREPVRKPGNPRTATRGGEGGKLLVRVDDASYYKPWHSGPKRGQHVRVMNDPVGDGG